MIASVALLLLYAQLAVGEFYYPPQKGRGVFKIGGVQTITYKTSFEKYTIALWQQSLHEGSAGLGPIVYRKYLLSNVCDPYPDFVLTNDIETTTGPSGRFDWLVQTYNFNLQASNVFFFWLVEGDASSQGNQSAPGMVSSFFNITDVENEATTSSATPSATHSTTTSEASTSSTTSSSVKTGLPSTNVPDQSSEGSNNSNKSTQLSSGAIAGIGVGAGLGVLGIAVGIATVLWLKHRKKKDAEKAAREHHNQHYAPPYQENPWKPAFREPVRPPRSPVELEH